MISNWEGRVSGRPREEGEKERKEEKERNQTLLTFGRKIVAAGDLGFARLAAVERLALVVQTGAGRLVDAAVHWNGDRETEEVKKPAGRIAQHTSRSGRAN